MRACPKCGSTDVRRSMRRKMMDYVLGQIGLAPYRCRNCRSRFFRPVGHGRAGGGRPASQRADEAALVQELQ
jgi:transposase-like protein